MHYFGCSKLFPIFYPKYIVTAMSYLNLRPELETKNVFTRTSIITGQT